MPFTEMLTLQAEESISRTAVTHLQESGFEISEWREWKLYRAYPGIAQKDAEVE